MNKVILNIDGMSCSACSNGLEKYLKKQKGILEVSVNLVLAQAMISYDDSVNLNDLERFIKEAGFLSLGIDRQKAGKSKKKNYLVFLPFCYVFLCIYQWGI